jgi:hypothetical protein
MKSSRNRTLLFKLEEMVFTQKVLLHFKLGAIQHPGAYNAYLHKQDGALV